MFTLYQFDISPFCDKVRRILNVKGQDYAIREVKISQAGRLRDISPSGKYPVLDHDGQRISDSTDIAHYLERLFPQPPLVPADPHEAALVHVLEDWADESLYFQEMTMRLVWPQNAKHWAPILLKDEGALFRMIGPRMVPKIAARQSKAQGTGRKSQAQIITDLERHADAVAGLLGARNYLVGKMLSLADISVFAQLFCIDGTPEGKAVIDARPGLRAWMTRVDQETCKRK
ncbi:MAG TPA: glutathione S-transferase family protein [Micropepsaceae bacterium]|nr:glutathione S-transferase family protein [Micropepsaceae bacterium]